MWNLNALAKNLQQQVEKSGINAHLVRPTHFLGHRQCFESLQSNAEHTQVSSIMTQTCGKEHISMPAMLRQTLHFIKTPTDQL
jgi:hypothetical protein